MALFEFSTEIYSSRYFIEATDSFIGRWHFQPGSFLMVCMNGLRCRVGVISLHPTGWEEVAYAKRRDDDLVNPARILEPENYELPEFVFSDEEVIHLGAQISLRLMSRSVDDFWNYLDSSGVDIRLN